MIISQDFPDPTINLAFDTIKKKKQAIVFVSTKNSAEKTAEEIAKKVKNKSLPELSNKALDALESPTKQCKRLAKCLEKGIAFHHAGLTTKQRDLIEEGFRNRTISIIAATPTLAAGVDLPAFRVILKSMKRYSFRGLQYIPVLEYMQMSGRAGRPSFDTKGEAVLVSTSDAQKEELTNRYLYGQPEPIYSKLAVEPVLRTYVLSLIATGLVKDKKQLFDFFGKTFWAHQFGDEQKLQGTIQKVLDTLEEWEFVQTQSEDFASAKDLLEEGYRATLLGKRVAELYIDPYTAHYLRGCLKEAAARKPRTFSYVQALCATLEMRPLLNVRVKEQDMVHEALLKFGDDLLDKEPSLYDPEYEDFAKSIKTALFFSEWMDETAEEHLLEAFNIRPGEIRAKLSIADWLIYCMEEIARIQGFKELIQVLRRLRVRLQYGVKEELLPLLKFKGIGRMRARKLFANKVRDVKGVKEKDLASLSQIVGRKIAASLKKQVGEDVLIIKENKRKGQINLKDFNE